jgi:hypothetical protein
MEHAVDLYDRSGDPTARALIGALAAVRHAISRTRDASGFLLLCREILSAECRELVARMLMTSRRPASEADM